MTTRFSVTTLLVLVATVACLFGCAAAVQKRKLNASFDVPVSEPAVRRLSEVTSNIDIIATGEFAPGTYVYNTTAVAFDPDTHFRLKFSLPIDDPALIHTSKAVGTLTTTQPFRVNGIPAPQTLELNQGQVSLEVDLVRSLGAYMLNFLQKGGDVSDVHQILQNMHIEQATFDLRPDSVLELDPQRLHVGPDSKIAFYDVAVASDFSYHGNCVVQLNFLDDCEWTGPRAHCRFDGGNAKLQLEASKQNDKFTLALRKDKRSQAKFVLQTCTFSFGKNFRSTAQSPKCTLTPNELQWKFVHQAIKPELHMSADMELERPMLDLKSDAQETTAQFPDTVPARLQLDQDKRGISTDFSTTESTVAKSGKITIAKKATSLTISLADAEVGPTSYDKSGNFQFVLERGNAHLKRLDWRGNKSNFVLVTQGGDAALSIPQGLLLEHAVGSTATKLKMPLDVNLGTASLKFSNGETTLSDINGKLMIDVDREIQMSGDIAFTVPKSHVLSGQPVDVTARGLDLSVAKGAAILRLDKCSVVIPRGAIQDAINEKVPDKITLPMNKMLYEEEKWRYRKAIATTATIEKLKLEHMTPVSPGVVSYTADGDVVLEGTVEQQQRGPDGTVSGPWETRPWKVSGHVEGDGTVKYKFIGEEGAMQNRIAYELAFDAVVPQDVKLDWSEVAHGFLGFVERKFIVNKLRHLVIPVRYKSSMPLFAQDNALSRRLKVRGLVAKYTNDSTELDFVAEGRF